MFGIKRFVIADHERGLKFVDRRFETMLTPGVYWVVDVLGRIEVEIVDVTDPEFVHADLEVLLTTASAFPNDAVEVVALDHDHAALVYRNARVHQVLSPGSTHAFWTLAVDVRVEQFAVRDALRVPDPVLRALSQTSAPGLERARREHVYTTIVADNHAALLVINGELREVLEPGAYAYWTFQDSIAVELVDLRLQTLEVAGQEILTKDRVSLRATLIASYRVVDPVVARSTLSDISGALYRELQFALRAAVGARTLDELLADKTVLDQFLHERVSAKMHEHGLEVRGVGVRDLILPGDMKEILNQVVQAEKVAQANVIKRREETAATRSLLNTARLMDDNPTLLRLKELEVLEKVTDKVDRLTVFGGLEGVLKDTVRINVETG